MNNQDQQQQISADEVKNNFVSLFQSQDKHVTEKANKYLLNLQLSPQAWNISQELITNPQNSQNSLNQVFLQQIQFLGCQVLYHKTKSEFAVLDTNHLNEIRQYIFGILANEQLNLNKAARRQLCSCIGVIGLYGISTNWPTMIDDIIVFMQQNSNNLELGLEILDGFACDIDIIIIDAMKQSEIKRAARSNSVKLFEIFNSLINPNTNEQILQIALQCLVNWTSKGIKLQSLEDPSLIKNIGFLLIQKIQDEDIIQKIDEFFEELFANYENKQLRTQLELDSTASYTEVEKQNHQVILQLVAQLRKDFQHCMNDRELNPEFCKLYTNIIVNFVLNNDIYLLMEQQQAVQILELLLETVQHKSLKICRLSLDFWCTLRNNINDYLQKPEHSYIVEAYKQLLKYILFQARYRQVEHKKHEQDEKYFYEDIKLSEFRIVVADIIIHCLSAFRAQNEQQGLQYFSDTIFQLFNTNKQDPEYLLNLEVGIFACTSVHDDGYFFDKRTEFMDQVFQYLFSDNIPQDYFIVSQILQFIYEGNLHIRNSPMILEAVIQYLVKQIQVDDNRSLAASSFVAVADAIESHNLLETFQNLIAIFIQQIDKINEISTIQNVVTSTFTLALKLQDDSHKQQAVSTLFNIIDQRIKTFQSNQNPSQHDFNSLLNILCSVFKGFDAYQQNTLELINGCIKQFIDQNFTFLIEFYQKYGEADIDNFIFLINNVVKRTKHYIPDNFTLLINHSLQLFQQKPLKYYNLLKILFNMFEQFKGINNQAFNNWLLQQFQNFNDFMIQTINQTLDVDIINQWIRTLQKSAEYNSEVVLALQNFEQVFQMVIHILQTIINYTLTKDLLMFLIVFLKNPNIKTSPKFQNLVPQLVQAMFNALPDLEVSHLYYFSINLQSICQNLQILTKDQLAEVIYNAMQSQKYSSALRQDDPEQKKQQYEEYKKLFAKGIITLSLPGTMNKQKLSLQDMIFMVNRKIDLADAYSALNFKLGNEQQIIL